MWQVFGHDRAVESIKRSLEAQRLAHAYLITGPYNIGKKTLAINMAQAVNCQQAPAPCGECSSCLRITSANHPDVQIIGRLSENGSGAKREISISQIRELQQSAALRPYEGKYRVFIIDSGEHLNEESANCLLKTLEEPPAGVLIILLAADPGKLLATIISRCQKIELFPVNPAITEQVLIDRWQVEPQKAQRLGRLCHGGIGWAINAALDNTVLQERTSRLAELTDLAATSLDQRFAFAARLATQYSKDRGMVEDTLQLWIEWWRDLLLLKGECPQFITNVDLMEALQKHSEEYEIRDIREFIAAVYQSIEQLEQNANPRLVLEVLMLSVPGKTRSRNEETHILGLLK